MIQVETDTRDGGGATASRSRLILQQLSAVEGAPDRPLHAQRQDASVPRHSGRASGGLLLLLRAHHAERVAAPSATERRRRHRNRLVRRRRRLWGGCWRLHRCKSKGVERCRLACHYCRRCRRSGGGNLPKVGPKVGRKRGCRRRLERKRVDHRRRSRRLLRRSCLVRWRRCKGVSRGECVCEQSGSSRRRGRSRGCRRRQSEGIAGRESRRGGLARGRCRSKRICERIRKRVCCCSCCLRRRRRLRVRVRNAILLIRRRARLGRERGRGRLGGRCRPRISRVCHICRRSRHCRRAAKHVKEVGRSARRPCRRRHRRRSCCRRRPESRKHVHFRRGGC